MHTYVKKISLLCFLMLGAYFVLQFKKTNNELPVIAIASYGPHASLHEAIEGIQAELREAGYVDQQNVRYEIRDVGFDPLLIPQMLNYLKNLSPKILFVLTTPVAQYAKSNIHDIPLIYSVVTDPVDAGLLKERLRSDGNMTGSSDQQDLRAVLQFAKQMLPTAKRVGLLYATGESNDLALLRMLQAASQSEGMELVSVAVDQARDVPLRMQSFKGAVDFIYVGTSGPIQPALPAIAMEADRMRIPIFNAHEDAVKDGLALASFGVHYQQVGRSAARLALKVLRGVPMSAITPIYPVAEDHRPFVHQAKAEALGLQVPRTVTLL